MLTRKIRHLIAVFCVAMLGWSQFAVASYTGMQDVPKMASMQGMQPDCAGGMHEKPSILCKVHCESSTPSPQAMDMAETILPMLCMTASPVVPGHDLRNTSAPNSYSQSGAPPPLRIQYQVFRI